MNLGIKALDEGLVQNFIYSFAAIQNRNYVVMEVRRTLIKDERATLINKFCSSTYKKIAYVQLGEPNKEFKAKTEQVNLAQKQKAADFEFRKKQEEEKRR